MYINKLVYCFHLLDPCELAIHSRALHGKISRIITYSELTWSHTMHSVSFSDATLSMHHHFCLIAWSGHNISMSLFVLVPATTRCVSLTSILPYAKVPILQEYIEQAIFRKLFTFCTWCHHSIFVAFDDDHTCIVLHHKFVSKGNPVK